MRLSIDFLSRIVVGIAGSILAAFLGNTLAGLLEGNVEAFVVIFGLLGFLSGLILGPDLSVRPLRRITRRLSMMPPERLVAIIAGIFLGLVAAALVSLPLSLLPSPFRQIMPLTAAIIFCYLSVIMLVARQHDLQAYFSNLRPILSTVSKQGEEQEPTEIVKENFILLDTSVIIDGRIADVSRTGFIQNTLLVPNFILSELQHIADSPEALRRNRGRRGLEILSMLQNDAAVPIRITDMDVTEVRDADSKLVSLARHLGCPVMTNDYNLNRVAELQGIHVLNINDLANAVKAVHIPGEDLNVTIIQEGKEMGQGVAFLEDGTMVVVENGRNRMNENLDVTVTKVLQTSAGRMIFAKP